MSLELRCNVTFPTAIDAADANKQAASVGSIRPPLEDFANYFFNPAHLLVPLVLFCGAILSWPVEYAHPIVEFFKAHEDDEAFIPGYKLPQST